VITQFQYREMLARTTRGQIKEPEEAVEHERDLHEDIIAECRRREWIPIFSRMDRKTRNPVGTPDFIIATDFGVTLYIEAKSRTGKLSTHQRATLAWLQKNKQIVGVVGSMSDFYAIISDLQTAVHQRE